MQNIFTFLTILCVSLGYGQILTETEKTIPESYVNKKAIDYIKSHYPLEQVIWVSVESDHKKSIQAKFNLKKEKHTVQFHPNGTLELLEITKTFNNLNKGLISNITNHLKNKFSKYRIITTHLQLVKGSTSKTNYKLEVYGKVDKKKQRYRIVYNHNGDFITQITIKEQPAIYLQH